MNAHEQVVTLLAEMRTAVAQRRPFQEIVDKSDAIETLSRSYMEEPTPTLRWRTYGFSHSEARILALLHRRKGKVVSYAAVLDALYFDRQEPTGTMNTMKVFLTLVRAKLKRVGLPFQVETVRSVGFCLKDAV